MLHFMANFDYIITNVYYSSKWCMFVVGASAMWLLWAVRPVPLADDKLLTPSVTIDVHRNDQSIRLEFPFVFSARLTR